MSENKLPPLEQVDEDLPKAQTTELKFETCKHELYVVSATEARCKRCPVGYSGPNIMQLVKASQDT